MSADMDNLTFQLECPDAATDAVESDDDEITNQEDLIADVAQVAAAAAATATNNPRTSPTKEEVYNNSAQ